MGATDVVAVFHQTADFPDFVQMSEPLTVPIWATLHARPTVGFADAARATGPLLPARVNTSVDANSAPRELNVRFMTITLFTTRDLRSGYSAARAAVPSDIRLQVAGRR